MSRALRDARSRSGLSKADAADKVGVHFVTLYAWENENRTDQPSDENLARAARAYGTTAETLQRRAKAIEQGLSAQPAASETTDSAAVSSPSKARTNRLATKGVEADNGHRKAEPASKTAAVKRPVGRPRSAATRDGGRSRGRTDSSVTLSHTAYARVLRVLADLAEDLALSPSDVGAAQQALTAPGLLNVFAAFTRTPMTDADILNAIDATGVAVRSFVSARKTPAGQK